ncbi:hypothetical protein CASFOL_025623 [Castilleja foliolosa]|uniref:Arf-GAP domain-containing protein n=1 Tax=Castilleja foliolosa TaxID=1961234 RepID=A0ABD3CSU2_9LAMI
MSSKREEERNEKIIRGLLKLPPNRRCINCNSMGPQYVCTNFWTFVCITCSGIHREFTHRVKSVSMAKFTSQEVDALQSGGNQRARELFLKAWDPQKNRVPDNSNVDKVREFIKKVYVDRLYFQEKSTDRPPRDPQSLRSHEDQTRRASSYHSYSQSPPYDFQYEERRYGGKHGPALTRKPGSDRGPYEGKLSSFLSPTHSSDLANSEGFANEGSHARYSDFSVSGAGDPFRSGGLSPSSQRNTGSPFSETSRDFSNEAPQLHKVTQSSDATNTSNGGKILHPQTSAASGSFGSFDSGTMSFKSVNSLDVPEFVSEPEQCAKASQEKSSSFLSPSQSSVSLTFDELDLFSSPFAPQNDTSKPLDLFSGLSQQQSAPVAVTPNDGGWATFDMMPQNVVSTGTEKPTPVAMPSSDGNVIGSFNPFSADESSSFSGHGPSGLPTPAFGHESLLNENHTHSWNAFNDSAGVQPIHNVNYSFDADKSLGNGVYKTSNNDGNVRTTNESEPPSSSLLPPSNTVLNGFPVVSAVSGIHSFAADHNKSANPFDLPYEPDMESSNTFWNTSSLQAALPNTQEPFSYTVNQTWAFQNPDPSYVPGGVPFDPTSGSLGFLAGQAPSNQAPGGVHAQGPVASIGGNPFA